MPDWFINIVKEWGLPTALVVFFIWRDYIREKRMAETIRMLEAEMRDILKNLVTKCTEALVGNTYAMNAVTKVVEKCHEKTLKNEV